MLKLAGELIEGQLADHIAQLDAHTYNIFEKLRVNNYRISILDTLATSDSPFTFTADRLYATPFPVPRTLTLDRLAAFVKVAATDKSIRLGIYEDDGVNPGALLLDAGTVSTTNIGLKTITVNQQLAKGLYWLVCISDGTPDLYRGSGGSSVIGSHSDTSYNYQAAGLYIDDPSPGTWFAALPDPFPASPTRYYYIPLLGVRIKSLD